MFIVLFDSVKAEGQAAKKVYFLNKHHILWVEPLEISKETQAHEDLAMDGPE